MADLTIKQGDTWPPVRGRAATEADGTVDLTAADSMKLIIKHQTSPTILEVVPVAIDPGTNDGFNWQYTWADGDTDELGTYDVELEVTWNSGTTPPEVQTFPNEGFVELAVVPDLGGDR